jgi:hypothetical protein
LLRPAEALIQFEAIEPELYRFLGYRVEMVE